MDIRHEKVKVVTDTKKLKTHRPKYMALTASQSYTTILKHRTYIEHGGQTGQPKICSHFTFTEIYAYSV